MKKLLVSLGSIISALAVTGIASATIIACAPDGDDTPVKKQLGDILKNTALRKVRW